MESSFVTDGMETPIELVEGWEFLNEVEIDVQIVSEESIQKDVLDRVCAEVKTVCENLHRKAGVTLNCEVTVEHLLQIFCLRAFHRQ